MGEFEDHVIQLIDDSVLRRDLGRTARLYASSFDWGRAGRRLESVIASVVGQGDRYRDDVIDLDALIASRPTHLRVVEDEDVRSAAS